MINRTAITIGLVAFCAGGGVVAPSQGQYSCLDNFQCPFGYYCQKAEGDCWGEGWCQPRPEVCALWYDPVCGCDGMTYSNGGCAALYGLNVAFDGPCSSCIDNADCPARSYCDKPIGDCDGAGVCQPSPAACEPLIEPVCGCDNVTYENDCEAAIAGLTIQYLGPCMPAMSDYDGDGDVDQTDFGFLQRCISGKDVSQTDSYCRPMRMDADEDVDGGDILAFLACLGGPNTLTDSDCIDRP